MAESHRIRFDPVDIEMEVGEDETILDAAFRQGIHLMHGCREGQCSACKSFVVDGDIEMDHGRRDCSRDKRDRRADDGSDDSQDSPRTVDRILRRHQ